MAFVTVEDLYGTIECVCFPKVYDRIRSFLAIDKPVSLSGKMSIEPEKAPAIIVDKMTEFSLEGENENKKQSEERTFKKAPAQEKSDSEKRLWLNVSDLEEADREELLDTLIYYKGETEVVFVANGKKMLCSQKVTPNRALMAELASFLPENCIKLL